MGSLEPPFEILVSILGICVPFLLAAFPPDCDYLQDFIVGQKYYIYSPGYPDNYHPSTDCFWYGASPPGTNIVISCEDINLPSTPNCRGDKLKISLTGNRNFADSKNYCGRGTVSLLSKQNKMSVELSATFNSAGGRFLCTLTAIENFESEDNSTVDPAVTTCDCGLKPGTRIVGGTDTEINEYPSMAGLIDAPNPEIVCGANIITDRYLLTAAHCMLAIPLQTLGVLVGDWNISTGADTPFAALYRAQTVYVHPKFNAEKQLNDIAIVKTEKKILFSLKVNPVCLPFRFTTYNFSGQNVTLLGWGQLFFSGPMSETLQKVDVDVVNNTYCQEKLPSNTITNLQICTYSPGKDACQSDSGGPLLWNDPISDRLQQIGVVSYGYACATKRPGVHTRVTSYLPWIISKTSDARYCIK